MKRTSMRAELSRRIRKRVKGARRMLTDIGGTAMGAVRWLQDSIARQRAGSARGASEGHGQEKKAA